LHYDLRSSSRTSPPTAGAFRDPRCSVQELVETPEDVEAWTPAFAGVTS
jgi:hypothetical protein